MNYSNQTTDPKPKARRKKIFLLGLSALGLGMLTFFSIRFWKKHKEQTAKTSTTQTKTNTQEETKIKKPTGKATKASKAPNTFSKPSTGGNAKTNTTTTSTPPPKGASKPINALLLAKAIHNAVTKKDFAKSFLFLKPIKNTKDYSAVNKVFSQFLVGGVRQTLVTALLNTFKEESQKTALRKAFSAMGLKYNGKKWSLSGLEDSEVKDSAQIITTTETKVWKNPRTSVTVPINMVLGREVCKRGTHTLFENDSQYFLVESNAVKAYQ